MHDPVTLLARGEAPSSCDPAGLIARLDRLAMTDIAHAATSARGTVPRLPPLVAAHLRRHAATADDRERAARTALCEALKTLARAGVRPLIVKGTALAYQAYADPALRPRLDTDLLIHVDERQATRRALEGLAYALPSARRGDFALRQFCAIARDATGTPQAITVHWRTSSRALYAGLCDATELHAAAVPLPGLSGLARGTGLAHALLLACLQLHLAPHADRRSLGLYDIWSMLGRFSPQGFQEAWSLLRFKGLAVISRRQIVDALLAYGEPPGRSLTTLHHVIAGLPPDPEREQDTATLLRPVRHAFTELKAEVLVALQGYLVPRSLIRK